MYVRQIDDYYDPETAVAQAWLPIKIIEDIGIYL